MECTQILVESDEESADPPTDNRRQVATLKTNGDSYPIFVGENRIGRDPNTCSIVFDNMALSSQHAVIEGLACGSFIIYDLNSRNKTRLGKMSLTPQVRYQLKNGESLRFANIHCTFCVKESINLVHLSLDDDIEELKKDTKEESPNNSTDPNTSAIDEDIFEADTQRPEEAFEAMSKAPQENAEHIFKIPGTSKNLNSSVSSLNKSMNSNCDEYDIFDLPTQPFIREEETDVVSKEKTCQQDKGGGTDTTQPLSNSESMTQVDSSKLEMDEKAEMTENVQEEEKDEDSDLEDIFAAATQVYPSEKDKTDQKEVDSSGGDCKSSDKNINSSLDDQNSEKEADKGLIESDTDDIFAADTVPFEMENGESAKKNDEIGKNVDFATGEDSDDDIFTAKALPLQKAEKAAEGEDQEVSAVNSPEDDSGMAAKDTSAPAAGEKDEKNETKGRKQEVGSGYETDGEETDAEDSFLIKIEEEKQKSSCVGAEDNDVHFGNHAGKMGHSMPPIRTNDDDDDTDIEDMCPPSVKKPLPSQKGVFRKANDRDRTRLGLGESNYDIISISSASTSSKSEGSSDDLTKGEVKINLSQSKNDNSLGVLADATFDDEKVTSVKENQSSCLIIVSDTDDEKEMDESLATLDLAKLKVKEQFIDPASPHKSLVLRLGTEDKDLVEKENKNSDKTQAEVPSSVEQTAEVKEKPNSLIEENAHGQEISQGSSEESSVIKADIENEDKESDKSKTSDVFQDDSEKKAAFTDEMKEAKESNNDKSVVVSEKSESSHVNMSCDGGVSAINPSSSVNESKKEVVDMTLDFTLPVPWLHVSSEKLGKPTENKPLVSVKHNEVVDSNQNISEVVPSNKNDKTESSTEKSRTVLTPSDTKVETVDVNISDEDTVDGLDLVQKDNKSKCLDKNEGETDSSSLHNHPPSDMQSLKSEQDEFQTRKETDKISTSPSEDAIKIIAQMNVSGDEKNPFFGFQNPEKISSRKDIVSKLHTKKKDLESMKPASSNEGRIHKANESLSSSNQAPSELQTSKEENDEEDISMLDTQPPPVSKEVTHDDIENKNHTDLFKSETVPEFKTPVTVKEKSKESKEDLSLLEQKHSALKLEDNENEVDEDDMSSFLTQAPPDFKTPQAVKEKSDDEEDLSMLETQPPPGFETSKTSNRKLNEDEEHRMLETHPPTISKEDSDEEDDMSSFLTQAPPEFKTPKVVKEKSSDDEEDLSMLDTQPRPTSKEGITKYEEDEDMSSFLKQAPPDFKTPKAVKEKQIGDEEDSSLLDTKPSPTSKENISVDEDDEEDMSSFLTQVPPGFKTPQAAQEKSADEEDLSMLETQPPPGFETPKTSNGKPNENKAECALESQPPTISKETINADKEVEEATSEFKTPKSVKEKLADDEEDLSTFDTQPAPTSKESIIENEEDMSSFLTQAPPEFKTPKAVKEKSSDDEEDLSTLDTQPRPTSKESIIENEEDEEDMSSFLTQAPPEFKTPKAVKEKPSDDEEDLSTLDTQPRPTSKESIVENEEDEEDMSSFLTQAPPEFKTPKAVKEKPSDDEEDLSTLDTQPRPTSKESIVENEEDEEDMSSFLTQPPPEFKTPKAVKAKPSDDEEDLSTLDTQPRPTSKESIIENEDEDDMSSFLTQAPPDFKTPKAVKENLANDEEEDLSMLDTQPSPTSKILEESEENDEEDMSSFLTQAPPVFSTPKIAIKVENEEVPEFKTPLVVDEKLIDDEESTPDFMPVEKNKNLDLAVAEKSETKLLSKMNKGEDLERSETQPVPTTANLKTKPQRIKESVCPSFNKPAPGIENVSSDEEDLSSFETQPAPIPELMVVNGKQERTDTFKPFVKPSDHSTLTEITPSRSLRKKVLKKNKKDAKISLSLDSKNASVTDFKDDLDDDFDLESILPDTPDLAATVNESKLIKSSAACKNLFLADESKIEDDCTKLSPETEFKDSTEREKGKEASKHLKEVAKTKQPEVERRQPSRRNTNKKLISDGDKSTPDTQSRTSRRQREHKNDVAKGSPPKRKTEELLDLSSNNEPVPKRRAGLREERSKVLGEEKQSKDDKVKEGNATDKKINVRKRVESNPLEVVKSEVSAVTDEGMKRGRLSKRNQENDLKAKLSKGLSTILTKSVKEKEVGSTEAEVKSLEVKDVAKKVEDKQTISKRRLSNSMEEISLDKPVKKVRGDKLDTDSRISSPMRKRFHSKDKETQPLELRTRKENEKLSLKSKSEKELSPVRRLRGNLSKEDNSRKEEVPVSPTISRKRKPDSSGKSELSSTSSTSVASVMEGVRHSLRERKPKRRFSSEDRLKDEGKTASSEEIKRGRKTKVNKKDALADSGQVDLVMVPEPIPQDMKKRKAGDKETSRGSKRSRGSKEKGQEEDSTISPGDRRSKKGATTIEKSVSDTVPINESKQLDGEKDEKNRRATCRRGMKESNLYLKSPVPLEDRTDEKNTEKDLPSPKVNARGRRKSIEQTVPETTSQKEKNEESRRSHSKLEKDQQIEVTRGGRRGNRRLPSSDGLVPVSTPVVEEKEEKSNRRENLKEQDGGNIRGGRRRGGKAVDVSSEVSSEKLTTRQKTEVMAEKQETSVVEEVGIGRRRGRKGSLVKSPIPTAMVEKVDKVHTSTPVNAKQEFGGFDASLADLKTSPGSKRISGLSSRSSTNRDSVTGAAEQKILRGRQQKGKSFSVLFTGLNEPKLEEIVQRLGGSVVDTPQDCSILVTDRLRRTYKLLCIVARGIPIVTVQWLVQSSTTGKFLDPADFLISDKLTEKRFDFSLKTSLEKARSKPLLTGYSVIATPSVKPPPDEIKGIVTCAGGEYIPSLSELQNRTPSQLYVISCADDSAIWKNYLELGTKKRAVRGRGQRGKGKSAEEPSNVRLVGVEGLLVSVLRQKIDFEDKMFSLG